MRNLTGQKFNKLTVIEKTSNILSKNKKRSHSAWLCKCDCGTIIVIRSATLVSNQQQSCGCIIQNTGLSLKIGDKINKLTTVKYSKGYWYCKCDCGSEELNKILTSNLVSGNTKSCGCIKTKQSKINIGKINNKNN